MWVVTAIEERGMAIERRAAQPFEHADLDFVRVERRQAVEAGGETGQLLTRQASDQIGVQVGVGVPAQPGEIVHGLAVVLLATDQCLHGGVEALNPNFELQRSGRETHEPGFERFRQVVGNQFEVEE